jgi:hypothetical protein
MNRGDAEAAGLIEDDGFFPQIPMPGKGSYGHSRRPECGSRDGVDFSLRGYPQVAN